jgi:hypothetical protein
VGPKASLDTGARGIIILPLPEIQPRSPGRPARNQTLYCLSYAARIVGEYLAEISPRSGVLLEKQIATQVVTKCL